jgi:uncharacterized membrane protein (DUF4010 family)
MAYGGPRSCRSCLVANDRNVSGQVSQSDEGVEHTSMTAEWLGIVVAALGGLAIGIERQRSGHASGPLARLGGVRTFTLIGGIAGLAGWLTTVHLVGLAIVLTCGAVALVVSGYVAASRREVDATTEAAALIAIGAGLAAGAGWLALASAVVAVSTLLLVEKSDLHALVGRVNDDELRAAARFGVMAIVVLPLLPEGPIGPFGGIRPRDLWVLVLFFTGLSFAAYLARRLFGAGRGYPLAGLFGGLISSTNVTFTFARLSRQDPALTQPLAAGVIAACTMLFPRVLIAAAVLNPAVAQRLLPYLAAPFAIGAAVLAARWRNSAQAEHAPERAVNPLQIMPALQMAALFQLVLFGVAAIGRAFGDRGLLATGAVLGLTDVDALTISMTRTPMPGTAPAVAAEAIAIGILSNCLLKAMLALALGTPRFRRVVAAVPLAMAAAILVAIRITH